MFFVCLFLLFVFLLVTLGNKHWYIISTLNIQMRVSPMRVHVSPIRVSQNEGITNEGITNKGITNEGITNKGITKWGYHQWEYHLMRVSPIRVSRLCTHSSRKGSFFNQKILMFFLFHMLRGTSNEYPQHMFLWRNQKKYARVITKYSSLTIPLIINILHFLIWRTVPFSILM